MLGGLTGEITILTGTAHPELAEEIAACLGVPVSPLVITRLMDTELQVCIGESVRGRDVYIVQPTCPPVNEHLTELLIILDALRRASAGRVTAVIPYYGYARQDQKVAGREAIAARMVADMLTRCGVDRVLTLDLHSAQIQGFFDIPVDHLTAVRVLTEYIRRMKPEDAVVVAPDAGRFGMATEYANRLGLPVAIVQLRRSGPGEAGESFVVGDVRGRRPVIIDDMISTGETIHRCVCSLLEAGACPQIHIAVTHGVLVGRSMEYLQHPAVSGVAVTNTLPVGASKRISGLSVVSVGPLIAEAIACIHNDLSVSRLFG